MNVLIVYAHPEPKSFNGKMKALAIGLLQEMGHQVKVTDLYALEFNPMPGPGDFTYLDHLEYFDLQHEQLMANQNNSFEPDLQSEHEKLAWADTVIFQFPLWWFDMPAAMRGWIERVFSYGFAYGPKNQLKGKKAILSLTTGGPALYYMNGKKGTIEQQLWHIKKGIFEFVGMECLPPFVAYGPVKASEQERKQYLEDYKFFIKENFSGKKSEQSVED